MWYDVEWGKNGQRLNQFMVLLQVCRAFRIAAFESHTLLDWDFDFTNLIPYQQEGSPKRRTTRFRVTHLLDTLRG